jgi:hypothetical protein
MIYPNNEIIYLSGLERIEIPNIRFKEFNEGKI